MAKKPVSKNISRLNEDIRRELIGIIGGMKDPRLKAGMLTITRVETAPDLSTARVHVSVMGDEGAADGMGATKDVVAALAKAKGHVRSEIASRMHIRRAPELIFMEDEGAAYADHINKMLRDL